MEDTATQPATQPVADANGREQSVLFDRELRDLICILRPTSESAHKAVNAVVRLSPQHILQNEHLDGGHLAATTTLNTRHGIKSRPSFDIALRLSSKVRDIKMGFCFGRNPQKTDILLNDELSKARISNNHFRIYLTEEGIIMLEDNSTNGTLVDDYLLTSSKNTGPHVSGKSRALQHGSVITLITGSHEEIKFIVHCPNRYEQRQNYENEFAKYCEIRRQEFRKAVAAQRLHNGLQDGAEFGTRPQGVDSTGVPESRQGMPADADPPEPEYRVNSGFMITSGSSRPSVMREWNGEPSYHAERPFGKGAFASVYKAVRIKDGKIFAIKELERRAFKKANVLDSRVEDEVTIMKQLSHPHIIQYMEAAYKPNFVYIVMEFARDGSMAEYLKTGFSSRLTSEVLVKTMAQQSLMALDYLHSKRITHRDIKPDNILVVSRNPFVVKLADFGLSKISEQEKTMLQTFCGTIYYCAPEVYADYTSYVNVDMVERDLEKTGHGGRYYNSFCDIWSMGTVVFHLLAGKEPYKHHDRIGMLKLIMTTELNILPLRQANISPEGIAFTETLIQRIPSQRPTAALCLSLPWLTSQDVAKTTGVGIDDGSRVAPTFVDANRNAGLGRRIKRKHGDYTRESDEDSDHEQLSQGASRLQIDEGRASKRASVRNPELNDDDPIESVDGFMNNGNGRNDQAAHLAALNAVKRTGGLRANNNSILEADEISSFGAYDQGGDRSFWVAAPNQAGTQVPGNRLFGEISQSEAVKSSGIFPANGGLQGQDHHEEETIPVAASLLGAENLIGQMNMASPTTHTSPIPARGSQSPSTPITPLTRPLTPSSSQMPHTYRPPSNSSTPLHNTPSRPFSRRVCFFPPDEAYWIPSKPHTYDPAYCDAQRAQNRQYQRWLEVQGEDYDDLVAANGPRSDTRDEFIALRIIETKRHLAQSSSAVPIPSLGSHHTLTPTPSIKNPSGPQVPTAILPGSLSSSPPPLLGSLTSVSESFATIVLNLYTETTSWGRDPTCTIVYPDPTDVRIPKKGLCIRFIDPRDPTRVLSRDDLSSAFPLALPSLPESSSQHQQSQQQSKIINDTESNSSTIAAMLSTEASLGVRVNGTKLKKELSSSGGFSGFSSNGSSNISGTRKLWGRLYTGDRIRLGKDLEFEVFLAVAGAKRPEGTRFEIENVPPGLETATTAASSSSGSIDSPLAATSRNLGL